MCRRILITQTYTLCRALQHSQACSHIQLGLAYPAVHSAALHTPSAAAIRQKSDRGKQPQQREVHCHLLSVLFGSSGPCQQQPGLASTAHYSSSPASSSEEDLRVVQAEISEHDFHQLADDTLDHLQEKLEVFVEDLDIDDADVEQSQGVLTVKLGSHGTYVINKQTPNRQLWLSSPLTGPFRYDYHEGHWVYHRDGRELLSQLQQELQQLLGATPQLIN